MAADKEILKTLHGYRQKAMDCAEVMLTNVRLRIDAPDWDTAELRDLCAAIRDLDTVAFGPMRVGVAESKEMTLDEAIEQYMRAREALRAETLPAKPGHTP